MLMKERGLSYRGLADAIRELDGKGVTYAHLNMLANGHDKPSMRVWSGSRGPVRSRRTTLPSIDSRWRCASLTRKLSGSTRRSRTLTLGSLPADEPVPEHGERERPEHDVIPLASDRVERAQRNPNSAAHASHAICTPRQVTSDSATACAQAGPNRNRRLTARLTGLRDGQA